VTGNAGPRLAHAWTALSTRSAEFWLVVVATAYTAVMYVAVVPVATLGADESVYASQVNPRVPPLKFSAPRARGITYLIAPILHVASSTVAMRAYLAVLAGVLLVVAYWPWLRVLNRPRVVPLAALVFASLWVTQFYGADDMPNAWVAFGAIAAVGWFVRYGRDRRTADLFGVAIPMAAIALLRPGDAVWIAVALLVVMIAQKRWRRPALFTAVLGGTAAGLAQWVVEAYQHFGGPITRLQHASDEQGGLAWHPSGVLDTLRSLAGPRLCRPCSASVRDLTHTGTALFTIWWFVFAALAIAGVFIARRVGQLAELAIPAACGTAVGLSYMITLNYAAPRFLLPAYGLLAIPVALAITALPSIAAARGRRAVLVLVVLALATNAVTQVVVLERQADVLVKGTFIKAGTRIPAVDRRCVVAGIHSAQVAYALGCRTLSPWRLNRYDGIESRVYLSDSPQAPKPFTNWRREQLRQPAGARRLYAYLPPVRSHA
jgi:hypothetical protein